MELEILMASNWIGNFHFYWWVRMFHVKHRVDFLKQSVSKESGGGWWMSSRAR